MAAFSLTSSEREAIVAAEKDAWQSIKDKKFDQFQKMLATDFRGVYASGINDADKEVAAIRTLDFKSTVLLSTQIAALDQSRTHAASNDRA
jgi:hypothetical protein